MRLELREGIQNCSIIYDVHYPPLGFVPAALSFLLRQKKQKRITLILAISGEEDLLTDISTIREMERVEKVIAIGAPKSHFNIPPAVEQEFFVTVEDFFATYKSSHFFNQSILIKGTKGLSLDTIANWLFKRAHPTQLEISLDAITHNLNLYRRNLDITTKMMVMVKARAYGSGAVEIAQILDNHGSVDYLSVAYPDEGAELRQAGVKKPILVLNPSPSAFDYFVRFHLEPEVHNFSLLGAFGEAIQKTNKTLSIHLKLETGMNRLGFTQEEIPEVLELLSQYPRLAVKGLMSHLAASDEKKQDEFTHQQYRRFEHMCQQIESGLGHPTLKHLLNSGGILRFPQYQMNLVRLGIGIYGMDNTGLIQPELQSVFRLRAEISQVKKISPGQTVGYGRAATARREMIIATVSLGYADGLLRQAGNGRFALVVHGQKAPSIGNICMDMCMIDVSDIPTVRVGDEVIVFDSYQQTKALAQALETIPYEVFTNISNRVERIYVKEVQAM